VDTGDEKKKVRSRASAFNKALRRLRSEKVEADWRLTISVNLGWRQVPGDAGCEGTTRGGWALGETSVAGGVGREVGVRTSVVVVAMPGNGL